MNWRRAGFITERLIEVLIPVCVFGLLAALVLHLIDLRSAFIAGGEAKLRQACLAFAAAIVLLERLAYLHGRSIARAYAWAVGLSMAAFALYYTDKFRLPAPFALVLAITMTIFAVLWWAGHRLSAACSVSEEKIVTEAAESGILRSLRPRARLKPRAAAPAPAKPATDERWTEKLSTRHPGRVLFCFSLVAVPLFGLGLLVFRPDDPARFRLGMMLFLYLWCALALLFLSSLRQLGVYFRQREVSLPDVIGLPWLALGFIGVSFALLLAFLLPQPLSVQNVYVREQIFTVYRGWEARHGFKDGKPASTRDAQGGEDGEPKPGSWEKMGKDMQEKQGAETRDIDRMKDPYLSEIQRYGGAQQEARNLSSLIQKSYDGFRAIFVTVIKVLYVVVGLSLAVLALICVVYFIRRLREGTGDVLARTRKLFLRDAAKKTAPARPRFPLFDNPFDDPEKLADRAGLVRYLWEATLAWCADAGSPCAPDQTPLEFVDARPAALAGFERQARFIARLFTFSEFSSQTIPDATLPELQRFWTELQLHASR